MRHGIDRVRRWLEELDSTLVIAQELVTRGREAYDHDPAIPLAFEALSTRVGDRAKLLVAADPERFNSSIWSRAARNRDFVVHHYEAIDADFFWATVTTSFGELHRVVLAHLSEPDRATKIDRVSHDDTATALRSRRTLIDGEFRPATVVVSGGVIVAVEPFDASLDGFGVPAENDTTLPDEQVLIPGIVDSHVHVNEPGRTDWEGFASATRAAARGGVTTIVDMPLNSIPPTTTVEALEIKRAAAAPQSVVDVGFWGGAIPSSLGALKPVHDAGAFGFKCFLSPSGVDEFPHLSTAQLHEAMAEIAAFDGLLIVHAEDPAGLDAAPAPEGVSYDAFVASRPDSSEQTAIGHVIDALRETGGRAHILHLSSAAALEQIRAAKAEGLRLTVETCPHYLSFDQEHIPDGATQYKCCPPIRDEHNQELLWEALVDGTIDIVASDHSPSTAELKFKGDGDFDLAWGGISGLELSFRAVWTGAASRGISLARVIAWMSTGTADLVGLADKGRIAVGARADLVAFDPDATFTVDATALAHKNPVSAFDGHVLRGHVAGTWVGGSLVTDASGPARLLARA